MAVINNNREVVINNSVNTNDCSLPPSILECSPLQALTGAALMLPGLLYPAAQAAEGDQVDFQYSHYQESKRAISGLLPDINTGENKVAGINNTLNPIEVDSLHGHANVSLTDRIKFAFNYIQDTWGGATPISTSPAVFGTNNPHYAGNGAIVTGASPLIVGKVLLDKKNNPLQSVFPSDLTSGLIRNNQLTHVMASASPETRKQGDFKLTHEWDETALSMGGGISIEDDYESRFGNIGGRLDLNQKQTTLNLDLSYTNSDNQAVLDHDATTYIDKQHYELNGQLQKSDGANIMHGTRQDWASHFGITQVINKNALVSADVGYTRSTGYLANPYKAVSVVFIDPLLQQPTDAQPG